MSGSVGTCSAWSNPPEGSATPSYDSRIGWPCRNRRVRHRGGGGSPLQFGRRLIQQRCPFPQGGCDLSGGLFSEIYDCYERLDSKFNAVARPLHRVGDVAGLECQRCHASDKPAADGRVDGPLNTLRMSAGLHVLLSGETISSHLSLSLCGSRPDAIRRPRFAEATYWLWLFAAFNACPSPR